MTPESRLALAQATRADLGALVEQLDDAFPELFMDNQDKIENRFGLEPHALASITEAYGTAAVLLANIVSVPFPNEIVINGSRRRYKAINAAGEVKRVDACFRHIASQQEPLRPKIGDSLDKVFAVVDTYYGLPTHLTSQYTIGASPKNILLMHALVLPLLYENSSK